MTALRGLRSALAAGVVLLGVSACAGVPSSSEVQSMPAQQEARLVGGPEIRVDFSGPDEDATPIEVVRGFLAANATTTEGLDRARSYLRPTVGGLWRPESVVIVSESGTEISQQVNGGADRLLWQAPAVAEVDSAGRYQPRAGLVSHEFRLQATDQGWRIDNPMDVLVLTEEDFSRVYRDVSVYYMARGRPVLVPDRRFVAAGRDELPGRVMAALVAGPAAWLAPSVQYEDTITLDGASVVDGVAEVRLGSEAALLSESRRAVLAAQIVTSLSGLGISGVRIVAGEQVLKVDAPDVSTASDWSRFQARTGPAELYLLTDGLLTDSAGSPPPGTEEIALAEAAVSAVNGEIAGVVRGGDEDSLVVVRGGAASEVLGAAGLSSPDWGAEGELYVIRDNASLLRLRLDRGEVPASPAWERVAVKGVPLPLRAVAVAPDGVRMAVVGGPPGSSRLYLGRIDGLPGFTAVEDTYGPAAPLVFVDSVAWSGETELLLAARTLTSAQAVPVTVGVDGSDLEIDSRIGLREAVTAVAAHPRGPFAVLSGGRAYLQRDDVWVAVGAGGESGSQPVYPS